MPDRSYPCSGKTALRTLALATIATVIALASGCAPTALSSAREKIAAGQYAQARQELLAIPLGNLNDAQRREVKDDLCVSVFMLGEPAYSNSEQRRVCADAATESGSQSAQIVEKIDDQVRRSSYEKVNAALASGDLGGAEQAAQVYVNMPGADQAVVEKWSQQMWELVNQRDDRTGGRRKKELAAAIAAYADDKKAHSIVELDLRGVVDYTDYFVICSGASNRQVKSIHDGIQLGCKSEHALLPTRVEGLPGAQWVLMDYLDVIVHVFMPEVREYYDLERLWGEVPARAIGAAAAAGAVPAA